MNVSINPMLEKFAEEQVQNGVYGSISEVINEALALLKDQQEHDILDDLSDSERAELRRKLQEGIDSLERGEGTEWDVDQIKAEGRRRLAQKRSADN